MGRFRVDYDELAELGRQLQAIETDLAGVDDHVEGYLDATGHPAVADKLSSFATNWDHTRDEIIGRVADLAAIAIGAAEAYAETDGCIADALAGVNPDQVRVA